MPAKCRSFSSSCWVEILDISDGFSFPSQKGYKAEANKYVECSLPQKHGIWIVALVRDAGGCGSCEWCFWGLSLWWEILLAPRTLRHETWTCSAVLPTGPRAHTDSVFCVTDTPPFFSASHSAGALPRAHQACLAFLWHKIVEEGLSVPKSHLNTTLVTERVNKAQEHH